MPNFILNGVQKASDSLIFPVEFKVSSSLGVFSFSLLALVDNLEEFIPNKGLKLRIGPRIYRLSAESTVLKVKGC
jgi:hypothetical protein